MNNKIIPAALLILIGFFVFSNYIFLQRVDWFPDKDEAYHAAISADIFQSIANGRGFSQHLLDANWPRGYHLISVLVRAVFGDRLIFMTPTLFLVILLCATYKIGEAVKDKMAGLLSALVVSLYPGIYVSSRHFDYELAQTAMAAVIIYLLMKNERFIGIRYSLLFGTLLAIGLVIKQSIIFFIAGPFIIAFYYLLKPFPNNRVRIRNLLIAFSLCFILAFFGYYRIYFSHPEYIDQWGVQRLFVKNIYGIRHAGHYRIGELLSSVTFLKDFHIGIPGIIIFLISLPAFLFKNKNLKYKLFLTSWLAIPFCIFSLSTMKLPHYSIGYLPAFAVITAVGITYLRPKAIAIWLVAGFFSINFIFYTCYTFNIFPGLENRLISKMLSANWGTWAMGAARDTNPAYEAADYLSKIAGNKRAVFGTVHYPQIDPDSRDDAWFAVCFNSLMRLRSSKYEAVDLVVYGNPKLTRKCDFFVCFSSVPGRNWLDYATFSRCLLEGMKYAAEFPYMGTYLLGDDDTPAYVEGRIYISRKTIEDLENYFPNLTLLKEIKIGEVTASIYKNKRIE
ncbi:MAG: glycosyltransferase family 39 protein [Candidatus Omnitrophota bacterium]